MEDGPALEEECYKSRTYQHFQSLNCETKILSCGMNMANVWIICHVNVSLCRPSRLRRLCSLPHLHLPQKGNPRWLKRSEQRTLWLLFHPGVGVRPSAPGQLCPLCPPAQKAVSQKATMTKKENLLSRVQLPLNHISKQASGNMMVVFCMTHYLLLQYIQHYLFIIASHFHSVMKDTSLFLPWWHKTIR